MCHKFAIIDTFSDHAFCGAPVAVFFVDTLQDINLFANISEELKTTETVFVKHNESNNYEVNVFCGGEQRMPFGSSLFATAFAINQNYGNCSDINIVHEYNVYKARVENSIVHVQFPTKELSRLAVPTVVHQAFNEIVVSIAECENILLIELRSQKKIAALSPDVSLLSQIEHDIIAVTSDAHYDHEADYDYCARVFSPKLNVDEAVAAPFVHCVLGQYWSQRIHKQSMHAVQCSCRHVDVDVCVDESSVIVSGACCFVVNGKLLI